MFAGPAPSKSPGVGTELMLILHSIGIDTDLGCSCKAKAAEWNRAGIDWYEQHTREITEYLVAQARERSWLLSAAASIATGAIVAQAIANARSKQQNREGSNAR